MKSGFERFSTCMIDWAAHIISATNGADLENANKNMMSFLRGEPRDHYPVTPLGELEQVLMDIFYEFIEIRETLEVIRDMRVYISRFPYSGTRIKRSRYLSHQIGIYLNEIYILRIRLTNLTKEIQNNISKSETRGTARPLVSPLFKAIKDSFAGIEKTRGNHVHIRRYSDDALSRISTFESLSIGMEEAGALSEFAYKKARKDWRARLLQNETTIDRFLDHYGNTLWKALFAPGMMFDVSRIPKPIDTSAHRR
ncbi:hypothetical protein [Burkholderia diffusa]|uniref:hypothetical protein n=1 Tax=Burkholderia diffusa TaxID=488732 RepID=UPI0012DB26CA|nr:hypothetical protein [Burkholderia diffusa]